MYELYFKRLFDIALSFVAIIALLPILFTLFVLVKIDSKGSFIFKTPRVGKNSKLFYIYKIRSMTQEASDDTNNPKTKYVTTTENDIRVTRLGRILRKYHLDEIPQFFNVLKGDMSIVGVRPDAISQKDDYVSDFWDLRNSIRPGITGLSQITPNKFADNLRNRNKLDSFYIKHKAKLKLDIYICYMTIIKMIKGGSF